MTDYERQFQRARHVCGEPLDAFRDFFESRAQREASVLDLGCGQGRDALVAARCGYRVLGVDRSPTGIAQMLEDAAAERLDVDGVVADVTEYTPPSRQFDVVVLDRVLHCLPNDEDRITVLARACRCLAPGGHVLIADTPRHLPWIRTQLAETCALTQDRKGTIVARKKGVS